MYNDNHARNVAILYYKGVENLSEERQRHTVKNWKRYRKTQYKSLEHYRWNKRYVKGKFEYNGDYILEGVFKVRKAKNGKEYYKKLIEITKTRGEHLEDEFQEWYKEMFCNVPEGYIDIKSMKDFFMYCNNIGVVKVSR